MPNVLCLLISFVSFLSCLRVFGVCEMLWKGWKYLNRSHTLILTPRSSVCLFFSPPNADSVKQCKGMVLFSQLVCSTCRKILTYPLGAISCRCRNCQTVNSTVHLEVVCSCCESTLLTPINTLTVLCPCCATITEIPIDLLPPLPEPVNLDTDDDKSAKTIYVEVPAPTTAAPGSPLPMLVATKIL